MVGNLAPGTTAAELEALFAQAGQVVAAQLLGDGSSPTQHSAQVIMADRTAAQTAIDLFHHTELAGREVTVRFAPARAAATGAAGQLSAFGSAQRPGKARPGQKPGGFQSGLGAFGGKSANLPPRRRGGSQHR